MKILLKLEDKNLSMFSGEGKETLAEDSQAFVCLDIESATASQAIILPRIGFSEEQLLKAVETRFSDEIVLEETLDANTLNSILNQQDLKEVPLLILFFKSLENRLGFSLYGRIKTNLIDFQSLKSEYPEPHHEEFIAGFGGKYSQIRVELKNKALEIRKDFLLSKLSKNDYEMAIDLIKNFTSKVISETFTMIWEHLVIDKSLNIEVDKNIRFLDWCPDFKEFNVKQS